MDWTSILEAWPDLVTRTTAGGVYTFVSAASRHLLGFAPADMVGRHAADFVHPDDLGDMVRHVDALRSGGPSPAVTVRVRRADGTYIRLETVTVLVRTEDGEQHLTCSRDVTDRFDRELRLGLAEARYRAVLDVLPEGVLLLDADGTVDAANPAAERLLGRSAGSLVGRQLPAELQLVADPADRLRESGEFRVSWPDRRGGAARTLLVRSLPLRRRGDPAASSVAVLVSDELRPIAGGGSSRPARSGERVELTPREREVLGLLADGRDVREIAASLQVRVGTVRGYVKAILGKFGVHSQLQAVVLATRQGLLRAPESG